MKKTFDGFNECDNFNSSYLNFSQDSGETILLSSKITRLDNCECQGGFFLLYEA